MPKQTPSSRIILSVERALSDLRRGMPVCIEKTDGTYEMVLSIEYAENNTFESIETEHDYPAVKLLKLAGLLPQAVIMLISKEEALKQDLLILSQGAIDAYPSALVASLEKVSEAFVPLKAAEMARVIAFRPRFGHEEHLAVCIGDFSKQEAPYVRVHSSCVTGDVFGSLRCDCGNQLRQAIALMQKAGAGVLLYLSQEGRNIGIANKLRAYQLQDAGLDTVEANEALGFAPDERDFALAAEILRQLGITRLKLLTNNPKKADALAQYGIIVEEQVSVLTERTSHNTKYLDTKAQKMNHNI